MTSVHLIECFEKIFTIEKPNLDGMEIEIAFPRNRLKIEEKKTSDVSVRFQQKNLKIASSTHFNDGFAKPTMSPNSKKCEPIKPSEDVSGKNAICRVSDAVKLR